MELSIHSISWLFNIDASSHTPRINGLRPPSYMTIWTQLKYPETPEIPQVHLEPVDDFEKTFPPFPKGQNKIEIHVQCQFQEFLFSSPVCWTFGVYMLGVAKALYFTQWVNNHLFYTNVYEVNTNGTWTLWRCISYWKWWFSIVMLVYQRVTSSINFY